MKYSIDTKLLSKGMESETTPFRAMSLPTVDTKPPPADPALDLVSRTVDELVGPNQA